MQQLKSDIKVLIVKALMLEEVKPAEIEDAAPLFGEGLGLDSVDALELAIEIERTFEVTIPDDEDNRKIFTSVDSLAAYITQHRAAAQA
jgi:acyl carrier protein